MPSVTVSLYTMQHKRTMPSEEDAIENHFLESLLVCCVQVSNAAVGTGVGALVAASTTL